MINTGKKYVICFLMLFITVMIMIFVTVFSFDPYFHYHKPYDFVRYVLNNQRYQNDGILRNFDYDGVIIGSSMIENTKNSEFDELYSVKSIKAPLSGASYKEINDNLKKALKNHKLKAVIRGLDIVKILDPADKMKYALNSYPTYLYDDNIFNDVKYIYNKATFVESVIPVAKRTLKRMASTTFDEYSYWNDYYEFGAEAIKKEYYREPNKKENKHLTEEDYKNIYENIMKNVIETVAENESTDFYYFWTPYSMYYWDALNQKGEIEQYLDAVEYATSLMVGYDNLHLYSFISDFEVVENSDNYKDICHYSKDINSKMLKMMKEGTYLLTKENHQKEMKKVKSFYLKYDYEKLFE